MVLALPLPREELPGHWACTEGRSTPGPCRCAPTRRHANQSSALPMPYVFKEWQKRLDQLQSDGDSRLPVHQAEHVAKDFQGLHPDVVVIILQSLNDVWQEALQSRCLHETHDFGL